MRFVRFWHELDQPGRVRLCPLIGVDQKWAGSGPSGPLLTRNGPRGALLLKKVAYFQLPNKLKRMPSVEISDGAGIFDRRHALG
jgi:hypothetical protein